jgi:hypothetical protein
MLMGVAFFAFEIKLLNEMVLNAAANNSNHSLSMKVQQVPAIL